MIVVDVETTGTRPDLHALISIGAVDLEAPQRRFYAECRAWEGAHIEPDALAVNGFTHAQILDPEKPPLEEVMGRFIAFCRDTTERTLGGFNTAFDHGFLESSVARCNLAWHFGHRVLDLHSFGWMHLRRSGVTPPLREGRSMLSLDYILQYCGLPPEPKPHNGLTGAMMEAEAFSRLLRGINLLPEYAVHPVPPSFVPGAATRGQGMLF
jgi:DNA polymerase III epsilon subunit-like protein